MNKVIQTGLELVFIFTSFLLGQYLRYRFPHFSMHFFDGISIFGINSFGYEKRCKLHNQNDIKKYKKRQKAIFKIMLILMISILIYYVCSEVLIL
jgi:hypothetical protein